MTKSVNNVKSVESVSINGIKFQIKDNFRLSYKDAKKVMSLILKDIRKRGYTDSISSEFITGCCIQLSAVSDPAFPFNGNFLYTLCNRIYMVSEGHLPNYYKFIEKREKCTHLRNW